MAVTNQPGAYAPSEFQTGLCDFTSDCGTCCYGLCCFPCMACSIAGDMDECCLCGFTVTMRSVYRTKYNINVGNVLRDSRGHTGDTARRGHNQGRMSHGSPGGPIYEHYIILKDISIPIYIHKGSLCGDYLKFACCRICATCQLRRDIDRRKEQGIF